MSMYRSTNGKDWLITALYGLIFVALLLLGAMVLLPTFWYAWLVIVAGGLFLLVYWHAQTYAYRCPNCRRLAVESGTEFEISPLVDFLSLQGVGRGKSGGFYGWKYLRCLKCKRWRKAVVLKKA